MKPEQEVVDRLKRYRINLGVAKTGRLENSQQFIQGAMRELNWMLDDKTDGKTVSKVKLD